MIIATLNTHVQGATVTRTLITDLKPGDIIRTSEDYGGAYEVREVKPQGGEGPVFLKVVGTVGMIATFFSPNTTFIRTREA